MVKMHKLTKGGQTIYPATITDAVVNPKTRKSLTTEISELESKSTVAVELPRSTVGGYYNTAGEVGDIASLIFTQSKNWSSHIIDVVKGDVLYISGIGGGTAKLYAIVDNSNRIIQTSGSITNFTTPTRIEVKENGRLIINQDYTSVTYNFASVLKGGLALSERYAYEAYSKLTGVKYDGDILNGKRVSSDTGELLTGSESSYVEINLEGIVYLRFIGSSYGGNYGYAFLTDDDIFISGEKTSETREYETLVPQNAKKFRLSWARNLVKEQTIFTYKTLIEEIPIIKETVNKLDHEIKNPNYDFLYYESMINESNIFLGKFVRSNGTEGNAKDFCCSDYVEVEEGEIYTAFNYATTHVALYNEFKEIKTNVTWQSGEVIPIGVRYIRLNQNNAGVATTFDNVKLALMKGDIKGNVLSPSIFKVTDFKKAGAPRNISRRSDINLFRGNGKNIVIMGSSLESQGKYIPTLDKIMQFNQILNVGRPGSTFDSTIHNFEEIAQKIEDGLGWVNIDILFFEWGGNELDSYALDLLQLGEWTDNYSSSPKSFYAQIKKFYELIINRLHSVGNTRCILFTYLRCDREVGVSVIENGADPNKKMYEILEIERDSYNRLGIPFADVYSLCGVRSGLNLDIYLPDKIHPNKEISIVIGRIIAQSMRRLYINDLGF